MGKRQDLTPSLTVSEVVERIAANPRRYPMRIGPARQANLERPWPYVLWFVAEPDGSIVIAALHARQSIAAVRKRLKP